MRGALTQELRVGRGEVFTQEATAYLAIVDVDSYPAFVGEKADRLDMLRHFSAQIENLTAAMWEVPDELLRVRLLLAGDDHVVEQAVGSGHFLVARSSVRTDGLLCFAADAQFLACARKRGRQLRSGWRGAEPRRPHLLSVPSGVYGVTIVSGSGLSGGAAEEAVHYTVVLRHYPHPSRRRGPVRLGGLALEAVPEAEDRSWMRKGTDFPQSF